MKIDNSADKMLDIIELVDALRAQLTIDGRKEIAERIGEAQEEFYWAYRELTTYE